MSRAARAYTDAEIAKERARALRAESDLDAKITASMPWLIRDAHGDVVGEPVPGLFGDTESILVYRDGYVWNASRHGAESTTLRGFPVLLLFAAPNCSSNPFLPPILAIPSYDGTPIQMDPADLFPARAYGPVYGSHVAPGGWRTITNVYSVARDNGCENLSSTYTWSGPAAVIIEGEPASFTPPLRLSK